MSASGFARSFFHADGSARFGAHAWKNGVIKPLLTALLYYFSGKASFEFFQQNLIVTLTPFAAEGFALAAVLIFGWRVIPGIVLGQFLLALDSGLPSAAAAGIALVNGSEAYLAVALFRRFSLERRLLRLRDAAGLVLVIALILQPFSALTGNAVLLVAGLEESGSYWKNAFFWWFGNVMGQLIFTPLLLVLYRERHRLRWRVFFLLFVAFTLWDYLLQIPLGVHSVALLLMATLPVTLYLATVDLGYALFASCVLTVTNLYLTHEGLGAFVTRDSAVENLIDLNFFMLNHILLVLLFGTLFAENKEAIRKLRSMAHYDYLTGLPNRYLLREEIHRTVYLAREEGAIGAICYIDLDGFKEVNDTMGHHVGDGVLREVVRRIERFTEGEDTFLRIGGDEFLVIFNGFGSKERLEERLGAILTAVAETIHVEGYEISLSLSVGVALCPEDGTTVEELMDAADGAMYAAKKGGKNRFVYARTSARGDDATS